MQFTAQIFSVHFGDVLLYFPALFKQMSFVPKIKTHLIYLMWNSIYLFFFFYVHFIIKIHAHYHECNSIYILYIHICIIVVYTCISQPPLSLLCIMYIYKNKLLIDDYQSVYWNKLLTLNSSFYGKCFYISHIARLFKNLKNINLNNWASFFICSCSIFPVKR